MKDFKVKLGAKNQTESGVIKPSGKFWKRLLNKRIRYHAFDEYFELRLKRANTPKVNSWFFWN